MKRLTLITICLVCMAAVCAKKDTDTDTGPKGGDVRWADNQVQYYSEYYGWSCCEYISRNEIITVIKQQTCEHENLKFIKIMNNSLESLFRCSDCDKAILRSPKELDCEQIKALEALGYNHKEMCEDYDSRTVWNTF